MFSNEFIRQDLRCMKSRENVFSIFQNDEKMLNTDIAQALVTVLMGCAAEVNLNSIFHYMAHDL